MKNDFRGPTNEKWFLIGNINITLHNLCSNSRYFNFSRETYQFKHSPHSNGIIQMYFYQWVFVLYKNCVPFTIEYEKENIWLTFLPLQQNSMHEHFPMLNGIGVTYNKWLYECVSAAHAINFFYNEYPTSWAIFPVGGDENRSYQFVEQFLLLFLSKYKFALLFVTLVSFIRDSKQD